VDGTYRLRVSLASVEVVALCFVVVTSEEGHVPQSGDHPDGAGMARAEVFLGDLTALEEGLLGSVNVTAPRQDGAAGVVQARLKVGARFEAIELGLAQLQPVLALVELGVHPTFKVAEFQGDPRDALVVPGGFGGKDGFLENLHGPLEVAGLTSSVTDVVQDLGG
jgi:hypothetical protein